MSHFCMSHSCMYICIHTHVMYHVTISICPPVSERGHTWKNTDPPSPLHTNTYQHSRFRQSEFLRERFWRLLQEIREFGWTPGELLRVLHLCFLSVVCICVYIYTYINTYASIYIQKKFDFTRPLLLTPYTHGVEKVDTYIYSNINA